VHAALDARPGSLPDGVEVEVRGGRVVLRGEVERPGAIAALERTAADVRGIRGVDSLLHLPGTRPPASSGRR
jgi:osmotically-inducible protein OsmY